MTSLDRLVAGLSDALTLAPAAGEEPG
jgi:hypothetical protein